MVKYSIIIATLLIIVSNIALAATTTANQLTASVSRNQLGIDESLTLQLTLSGDSDAEPDLAQLNQDFDIVSRSQNSSVNIINGSVTRSKVWSVVLLPRRSGTLTIPALCSGAICSQPRTIIVSDQAPADTSSAPVIVETEVDAPSVVVQQQLRYTVRVLLRQPLAQAGLSELAPQGVETTVQQLGDDVRYETQRGSYNYQVIERNYALFPQHSGTLHLPAQTLDGVVRSGRSTLNSAFSSPFDPFDLMGQQGQRIRVRSKALSVEVIAPPAHDPTRPWLPALDIQLSDDWRTNPPILTVGEPTTRTVIISSTGLAAAALPELTLSVPGSFKSYPDKSERKDGHGAEGVEGTVIQKMALVPTQAGTFTLEAVSLRWWDTGKQQWRTTTIPAIELKVLPAQRDAVAPPAPPIGGATTAPSPTEPAGSDTPAGKNHVPLSTPQPDSSAQPAAKDFTTNIWLWISLACVIGWLTTIYWFRRQTKSRAKGDTAHGNPHMAAPPSPSNPAQGARAPSLQQVIHCAQAHQASETRRALTLWIATLSEEFGIVNLDDFLSQAQQPLRQEITFLNQHLYALGRSTNASEDASATLWDGTTLAHELQQWQTNAQLKDKSGGGKTGKELPSFYPK